MKLPVIAGLRLEAARLRDAAAENELRASACGKDPRSAHEAGEAAARQRREAEKCSQMADADAGLIAKIIEIQNELEGGVLSSGLRNLALRDLQSAEAWLRREIGDPADGKN